MIENRFEYTAYDDGTESIYDRKEDKYYFDMQLSEIEELMNELAEENRQLKQEVKSLQEHFIYLIGTALEDKECRKIYAKGLLEIFDDCANLDEAKSKIKEYLE